MNLTQEVKRNHNLKIPDLGRLEQFTFATFNPPWIALLSSIKRFNKISPQDSDQDPGKTISSAD